MIELVLNLFFLLEAVEVVIFEVLHLGGPMFHLGRRLLLFLRRRHGVHL